MGKNEVEHEYKDMTVCQEVCKCGGVAASIALT